MLFSRYVKICTKCSKKFSFGNGSWFQRHSLEKKIICYIFLNLQIDQICVKLELSFSNQTIVDWYNYCSEKCIEILEIDSETIEGDSVIVEIIEL